MGKIFCLMGKSSSGKDTVYKKIMEENPLSLNIIVPCTTRPIRTGETHGVDYFFYTTRAMEELQAAGKIIELRSYNTVHGVWNYFTADDGQIDLSRNNYLMIGTLESYMKMQEYFGADALVPLYIYVDDGVRLQRALTREQLQAEPKYAEMCRRFLADEKDFSSENLALAGITTQFENLNSEDTAEAVLSYIQAHLE